MSQFVLKEEARGGDTVSGRLGTELKRGRAKLPGELPFPALSPDVMMVLAGQCEPERCTIALSRFVACW